MVTAGPMEQNIVPWGVGWGGVGAEVKVSARGPFKGPKFGVKGGGS